MNLFSILSIQLVSNLKPKLICTTDIYVYRCVTLGKSAHVEGNFLRVFEGFLKIFEGFEGFEGF